jgi:ABC-type dipeptide/oligopeptide/nickel transport system permease component
VETVSLAEYALRRLLWTVPLLLLVMLATFTLLRGAGGDPFNPPPNFSGVPLPLQNDLRAYYRLDEPWFVEFAVYVRNVFTFDFGPSLVQRDLRVDDVIEQSFPITLGLVGLAALWAVPTGTALGVYAASRRGSAADAAVTALASVALVVPVFFVAFVLARYGVRDWELAPPGWDTWDARVMPAFALGLAPMGYVARLVRAAFVEELDADFVRTARAKGLRWRRVLWVHVLPNSLAPVLAAAIPMLALLVTGAFFVEEAFAIPGASTFFIDAARSRDFPLLMGLTVALAVCVVLANAAADILLAVVDPRVREGLGR